MLINPKLLKKGDKVAIVSLSSGVLGEEYCSHQVELGVKRLKEMGLEPVFMPNSLKGLKYLKENPQKKADDLKMAFKDDEIKGIICAIGGEDGFKIFPYLMEDEEFKVLVKKNPKVFTGFSDTTHHHLMFYQLGLQTFYGPSFLTDIAELDKEMLEYTKEHFILNFLENNFVNDKKNNFKDNLTNEIVNNENFIEIKSSPIWFEERKTFTKENLEISREKHEEKYGFELIQGEKKFSGKLLGGCVESIYSLLTGDRYFEQKEISKKYKIFPSLEEWKNKIIFLETCEDKTKPEKFEIMLNEIKKTGVFDVVNAVFIGKPQDECFYEEYKEVLKKVINNEKLPILCNVNFGHCYPRCVLPYGAMAWYDDDKKVIKVKKINNE